jgi:PAS domain S-box-containing protein
MAIMADMAGTVRMFNRKAEKMTGYSKAESLGQDFFSLLLPEHLRDSAREKLMRDLEDGRVPPAISLDVITKSGVMIPVNWSISVVRDDDGEVFGMVGLGYLPVAMAPGAGAGDIGDNFYSYVEVKTHDLLNHSQVAMGYLELAIERADDDTDLKCMLNRACNALKKCGDIAVNVHKFSGSPDTSGYARLIGSTKR